MLIDTMRFGQVEIDETKILKFIEGLPGLEDCREYAILHFEEGNPIGWMQAVGTPHICLPVIDTFYALPDYAFTLGDEDVAQLEITDQTDIHVMSILVIPEQIEQMTANLAAPVVINTRLGVAKQIILSGGEYNVRYPIFAAICKLIREGGADAGPIAQGQ